MHHTERKSFELPCKYTIAASWAALRKAWLGFKIANSNDDTQKKRHYSRIIRKLQLELGKVLSVHFNREQNCQITSRDNRGSSADANEFTYHPTPNEDKFPVYFSREKNCFVVRQDTSNTAADVNESRYDHDRTMDYMPQLDATANPKPTGNSNKKTNSCYYKHKPDDNYQKKRSFACYYKSKPKPESEIT